MSVLMPVDTFRVFYIRRFLAFAMLCVSVVFSANAAEPPPDPSDLSASWWNYYTPTEEEDDSIVAPRVESTVQLLSALRAEFIASDEPRLAALTEGVIGNLRRYQKLNDALVPVPAVLKPAQDTYTLLEIRELIDELRTSGALQENEEQEIELLETAIDANQKELSREKIEYRSISESVAEKTEAGLELMSSRIQLEIRKRELQWRKTSSKSLREQTDHLQTLVEAAAQRLTATDEALKAATNARIEASRRAEELRLQVINAQLAQSGTLSGTPSERAQERLEEQAIVALEVEARTQEVIAEQNALVEKVLQRIMAGNQGDLKADRDYLGAYMDTLESLSTGIAARREATARSRETALSSIPDEDDPALLTLLERRVESANNTDRDIRTLEEQLLGAAQFGELLNSLLSQRESKVAKGLQIAESLAEFSWDRALGLATTSLFEIGGAPVAAYDILRMLLIITIAWWISKLLTRTLTGIAEKRQTVNTGSVYTLTRILHYVVLSIGIIVALSSIGIDFTKFALFASALGVGIGFGMQTLASNFVAGLIILFEKSLKISDFVELESGVTGEVREINMRSTLITTNDNIDIVVPNSEFVNGRVTNWTMREAQRRVHIPFGVAYGTDKNLVKKAALEAAENVPETLSNNTRRQAQLWFVEFGDSSLNFELVVWLTPDAVKRPGAVQAKYLWEIDDKLREYNIEVPFPQTDLHVRTVLGKHTLEELHLTGLTSPSKD